MEKVKMSISEASRLASIFKILGDTTRIRILESLKENGDFNVTCIAEVCELSQSLVSHQLKVLKDARLVKSRKSGKQVYYSLDDMHVLSLLDILNEHILENE